MNPAPAPGGPKVVVLVTGASGCGKTSLARSMTARLPGLAVIHQDSYFIQPFLDYDARLDDSFESPRSLGWAKLRADVGVAAATSGVAGVLVEGHMLPTDTELVRWHRTIRETAARPPYYKGRARFCCPQPA